MRYSTQPRFPTHGNCANFENGLCTLNRVAVDPTGAACPSFTPKSIMAKTQRVGAYSRARHPYQPYLPEIIQGYPPYMLPPLMPYHPPRYPYTPPSYPSQPQTGYGLPPLYAYPPCIGHSYPAPQYRLGYHYSLPYTRSQQAGYSYGTQYGPRRVSLTITPPRQGDADFTPVPPRVRGGGRMGGFRTEGGGRGGGRGRMGGIAAGPGGSCTCPSCGYRAPHIRGTPCFRQTCPQCGSRMTRER